MPSPPPTGWPRGPDRRRPPRPRAGPGEVVIDVVATAVNRADTLQRQGFYPPPPGASDVLGLECSGRVSAVGAGVEGWAVGDEVCALLAGGGYAEKVAVPAGQVMPVPARGRPGRPPAALPEVACTVWSNVFMIAGLQPDETLLVHGGAGGIGTFAIQLAKALGARVITTAGSAEKLEVCGVLGADLAINYRDQDFVEVVKEATDGAGVDVILDNMGAKYLARNVDALATEGRLVVIGMQGGTKAELDLGVLLGKRGAVHRHLAARPAPRGEGGDLRLGRRARVAADRGRQGADVRARRRAARGGRRGPRADGVERHSGKILLTVVGARSGAHARSVG